MLKLILMFATVPMYAQYKWKILETPLIDNYPANAISISDDGKYSTAVGRFMTVRESNDGGTSWNTKQIGTLGELRSVAYFSNQGAIAVGDYGVVFRQTEHNGTWAKQILPSESTLRCIKMITTTIGIIGSSKGDIYRTPDAGITWDKITTLSSGISSLSASDSGMCIAVGDQGLISISKDNGLTWNLTSEQAPINTNLNRVAYVKEGVWVITGDTSYIARTTDNGTTWKKIQLDSLIAPKLFFPLCLAFASTSYGVITGWNNITASAFIFCTSDGGESWYTGVDAFGTPNSDLMNCADIAFPSNNLSGVFCGAHDFAGTFRIIPDSLPYIYQRRVYARTKQGTTVISIQPTKNSTILYTSAKTDASSKRKISIEERDINNQLLKTWRSNDDYGTAVGTTYIGIRYHSSNEMSILADSNYYVGNSAMTSSRYYSTKDGGQTWITRKPENLPETIGTTSWKSFDEFLSNSGATLYVTSDQGQTWKSIARPSEYRSLRIVATTATYYYAIGVTQDYQYKLLQSETGETWNVIINAIPNAPIQFIDTTLGYIFTPTQVMHVHLPTKTEKGFLEVISTTSSQNATSIVSYDNKLFDISGAYSIRESTDSGKTFRIIRSDRTLETLITSAVNSERPISAFVLGSRLYVGMYFGIFMFADIKDTVTSVVEVSRDIYTNPPYPNPFSTSTEIRVAWFPTVPFRNLTLKVYTSLGVEVADLTKQLQSNVNMQEYYSTASFNATELPGGVYFVVCKGGGEVSTQQVVVVR